MRGERQEAIASLVGDQVVVTGWRAGSVRAGISLKLHEATATLLVYH